MCFVLQEKSCPAGHFFSSPARYAMIETPSTPTRAPAINPSAWARACSSTHNCLFHFPRIKRYIIQIRNQKRKKQIMTQREWKWIRRHDKCENKNDLMFRAVVRDFPGHVGAENGGNYRNSLHHYRCVCRLRKLCC